MIEAIELPLTIAVTILLSHPLQLLLMPVLQSVGPSETSVIIIFFSSTCSMTRSGDVHD